MLNISLISNSKNTASLWSRTTASIKSYFPVGLGRSLYLLCGCHWCCIASKTEAYGSGLPHWFYIPLWILLFPSKPWKVIISAMWLSLDEDQLRECLKETDGLPLWWQVAKLYWFLQLKNMGYDFANFAQKITFLLSCIWQTILSILESFSHNNNEFQKKKLLSEDPRTSSSQGKY